MIVAIVVIDESQSVVCVNSLNPSSALQDCPVYTVEVLECFFPPTKILDSEDEHKKLWIALAGVVLTNSLGNILNFKLL